MNKQTKKCAREDCVAMTTKEYCQPHAPRNHKRYPCQWPGCVRNCRKDFCHVHVPQYMNRKNERARAIRAASLPVNAIQAN